MKVSLRVINTAVLNCCYWSTAEAQIAYGHEPTNYSERRMIASRRISITSNVPIS